MKQIEPLNTKFEVKKVRSSGMPQNVPMETLLGLITDIQDRKINEIIETVNRLLNA